MLRPIAQPQSNKRGVIPNPVLLPLISGSRGAGGEKKKADIVIKKLIKSRHYPHKNNVMMNTIRVLSSQEKAKLYAFV
jgi:hypothetical protein